MCEYQIAAEAFESIEQEYAQLKSKDLSEADTRVKLIDRLLKETLGWPESGFSIRREEHIHKGYIDYTLHAGDNFLLLEAKKEGLSFSLPAGTSPSTRQTVKNTLSKQPDLQEMYDQVTRYAHERSVKYCALSNGPQWMIFPGVRTDNIHLRHSRVIIFHSLEQIRENFVDFWNLFSFDSVKDGSLDERLGPTLHAVQKSYLFNREGKQLISYNRNDLTPVLEEILPRYFGDLYGDPAQTDMLKECFVEQDSLVDILRQTTFGRADEAPSETLRSLGQMRYFYSLPDVGKRLQALMKSFLGDERNKYFQVLVGRVGIGKTTFLRHFFDVVMVDLRSDHFVLYMDYQNTSDSTDLEEFFEEAMWSMLMSHKRFDALTSRHTLLEIYGDEIAVLDRGPLSRLKKERPDEYGDRIDRYLEDQLCKRSRFLKHLATYLFTNSLARFVLIFDNVDQLPMELQEKVIRFAYAKTGSFHAFSILSMWEETYYASKHGSRVLSTIRTVPMLIARQSVTAVLIKRLRYLLRRIEEYKESLALLDTGGCSKQDFCDTLDLILRSLLVDNRKVRVFIELVALGNIRAALELFSNFLTAGSLDTPKIRGFMKMNEEYVVPIHEFIKSVMLGSRRYYSESTSSLLNLYAVGDVERPSHFTRLRLLNWLFDRRTQATGYGPGYVTCAEILVRFSEVGISKRDCGSSLMSLNANALIENDVRSQQLDTAKHAVRITPAGRYYLKFLYKEFSYLDLAMQDTPFFSWDSFKAIEIRCESTDMEKRFERCEVFLNYLEENESEELLTISKLGEEKTWLRTFVPNMRRSFDATRLYIKERGY